MDSMDSSWIPAAYEAANQGNFSDFAARLSPDGYVHHLPAIGVTWRGRDEALENLADLYQQFELTQHAREVINHGSYVVVLVTMRSARLGGREVPAVHVFRADGEKMVEFWALAPPAEPSP